MAAETVETPSGSSALSPSVNSMESPHGASDSLQSVVAVGSPCVNICELDTDFVCKGCGRSIEEILKWQEYTIEQQTAVLDRLFGPKER